MLRIALCDDTVSDLENTKQLLQGYMKMHPDLECDIVPFTSSEELVAKTKAGVSFDIYMLDVIMPDYTGIAVAQLLRDLGSHANIIFTTITPEYAVDAFNVLARHYLLKPFGVDTLYPILDRTIASVIEHSVVTTMVHTKTGLAVIPLNSITYIEYIRRVMYFHLSDGTVVISNGIRITFEAAVSNVLQDLRFLQIHKAYIVNMDYVKRFSSQTVMLDTNTELPVAKNRQSEVKSKYLHFLSAKHN